MSDERTCSGCGGCEGDTEAHRESVLEPGDLGLIEYRDGWWHSTCADADRRRRAQRAVIEWRSPERG
jgi:hypothetical protein